MKDRTMKHGVYAPGLPWQVVRLLKRSGKSLHLQKIAKRLDYPNYAYLTSVCCNLVKRGFLRNGDQIGEYQIRKGIE